MTWIYDFDHEHGVAPRTRVRDLGGKGANLAEMVSVLRLRVPAGFTISTDAWREWRARPDETMKTLRADVLPAVRRIEEKCGLRFGDARAPLLVSVRSGAPASMPGMLDTILDLGVTPESVVGLAERGGETFAWGCARRFVGTYARTILGAAGEDLPRALDDIERRHPSLDGRMRAAMAHMEARAIAIPLDPWEQLEAAIRAVLASWGCERAAAYRRIEGIDEDLGTAVNVQAMVFGDLDASSGTGVAFTRDPSTGAHALVGDYLAGSQGEDVVAGTHRVEPLDAMSRRLPAAYALLANSAARLERHYRDMCDIEFTVESGVLWLLQVRVGKRSPHAALRIAVDMARDPDFPLDRREAVLRVLGILAEPPRAEHPLDAFVPPDRLVRGIAASPGVASGRAHFDPSSVVEAASRGERAVLVRTATSPSDVHGMADAVAIVTTTGGPMSHAAVVAREWGIPAVVGVHGLEIASDHAILGRARIETGDWLTVDGSRGAIAIGRVDVPSDHLPEAEELRAWAAQLDIEIPCVGSDAAAWRTGSPPSTVCAYADSAPLGDTGGDQAIETDALVLLGIARWARTEDLAGRLGIGEERLAPILERLRGTGMLRDPGPRGWRLTDAGASEVELRFDRERARLGLAAGALLDAFDAPNRKAKRIFTAWQMRDVEGEPAPNLHDDAEYDASVMASLRSFHTEVDRWLAQNEPSVPLLARFHRRLGRAIAGLAAGDTRWMLSPRLDSYHTVWFELHECLIRLAGRNRSDEARAGRA